MSVASPKGRRSYSRSRSPAGGRDFRDPGGEENIGTVFVGNLNHETTEKALRDFFEQYGRVLETKVRD
jgi:RNA recognition motif-containing protein